MPQHNELPKWADTWLLNSEEMSIINDHAAAVNARTTIYTTP